MQAIALPIADRHNDAAAAAVAALRAAGLRAEVDDRTESVGRKIRDAELQKVPYMLVIGDREAEEGPSPCAATARATRARSRSPSSPSGWPARPRARASPAYGPNSPPHAPPPPPDEPPEEGAW